MTSDRQVEDLKLQLANLQARVDRLESEKLSASKGPSEAMRMILIGPPGAGMLSTPEEEATGVADTGVGKGTQAPKIKDKYCVCHLVRYTLKHLIDTSDIV